MALALMVETASVVSCASEPSMIARNRTRERGGPGRGQEAKKGKGWTIDMPPVMIQYD